MSTSLNPAQRVVKFFGIDDRSGDVSFNKCVTMFMLAMFAIIVLRELKPSPWVLSFGIVLVGAGFGLKGYLGGAARISASESSTSTSGEKA